MSYKTAIVVLSDSRSSGDREDLVIPVCRELLAGTAFEILATTVIPDDTETIIETLNRFVADPAISLVITSGGTGLAPRDKTPEATRAVIDREAPGLAELVRLRGLSYTPKAMLTRGIAGAKNRTLIINLPGSPKAVREGFEALMPVLPHALETLLGQASECGKLMVRELDLRGQSCPAPVIETRKVMLADAGTPLEVIVDNEAAGENVSRLARTLRAEVWVIERDNGDIRLRIDPNDLPIKTATDIQAGAPARATTGATAEDGHCGTVSSNVVLLNSASIGPDEKLGQLLMKAFIKTLPDVPPLPEVVILLNSGVKLTCEGSELVEELTELEKAGTTVLSCGTCLDYFNLNDKLAVGQVTNMFEVVSLLAGADRIIQP